MKVKVVVIWNTNIALFVYEYPILANNFAISSPIF